MRVIYAYETASVRNLPYTVVTLADGMYLYRVPQYSCLNVLRAIHDFGIALAMTISSDILLKPIADRFT